MKKLGFVLTTKRKLVVHSYNELLKRDFPLTYDLSQESPDEIYQFVFGLEKITRAKIRKPGDLLVREVIFSYHVQKWENMTDDRSSFGHEDQTTEKMVVESNSIFTVGKFTTLKDFFVSADYQKLGASGLVKFFQFIENNFEIEMVTVDFLESGREDIKFIYIIQEERLEFSSSVYWKFNDGDIYKPFVL